MLLFTAYTGYFFLLINNIIYFKKIKSFSKRYGKAFDYFAYYLLYSLIIQVFAEILSILYVNNLFLSHFYFLGQFLFLNFFFRELICSKKQRALWNKFFFISILVIFIQYFIEPQMINKFNLIEIFLTSFFIIIGATIYLYNLLEKQKKVFYTISIGLIIYLFGSTILFILGNLTNVLSENYTKIPWILNSVLYVVYQVFIFLEWSVLSKILKNESFSTK